jgi:HEAT repeat protein
MRNGSFWTTCLIFAIATLTLAGCDSKSQAKKGTAKKPATKPVQSPPPLPPDVKVPEKITVRPDEFPSVDAAIAELRRGAEAKDEAIIGRPELWLVGQAEKAVEAVSAVVRDEAESVESRIVACRVLPKLGPKTVETVVKASEVSAPPALRLKAIDSLGRFKPPAKAAIERLGALLDDEDHQVKMLALQSLANIGTPAESTAPKLLQMLKTEKNPQLMRQVDKAIKAVEPRRTLTPKN